MNVAEALKFLRRRARGRHDIAEPASRRSQYSSRVTTRMALYRDAFHAFMDRALSAEVPDDVIAFVLNLYEGEHTFDAQLAGTGESVFAVRRISVEDSRENARDLFRDLLIDYLSTGRNRQRLRRAKGVSVGFVNGDLVSIPDAYPTVTSRGHTMRACRLCGMYGSSVAPAIFFRVRCSKHSRMPNGGSSRTVSPAR